MSEMSHALRIAVIVGIFVVSPILAESQAQTPGSSPAAVTSPVGSSGIDIPAPPPPAGLSPDATQLGKQLEEEANRAQTAPAATTPQVVTQAQAQAAADAMQQQREQDHNVKSFDRAEKGMLPLSPEQVRDFMKRLEVMQKSSQPPTSGPPKPDIRTATLSLDPGVDPPVVNLVAGYVTTIAMIDASGEPWPILDVGVGGNFEVSPTRAGLHVVRVMPLARYGTGNISIILQGLSTPIVLRLSTGGPSVDMRYDARVPKMGPNAKTPVIGHTRTEAGDETIMMLLDNAPPGDARRMKISGLDARSMAWSLNGHVYVRTPLSLLSPAWDASVSSADGMTVYQIGDAPILLMSDNGAMIRARLLRDDDHDK